LPVLRLGLDLGTNSIGWALLELDDQHRPARLVDAGVRIFSSSRDPESDDPLGQARRLARQARRMRDRRIRRLQRVMAELVRLGLMPTDPAERKKLEAHDPYELRARALDEPLEPFELGRALFHLAQRRGYKSNRIVDRGKEEGVVRESITALRAELEANGCRTLGEYWWKRRKRGERVRGAFWTDRTMLEDEFRQIVRAQARFHPEFAPKLESSLQRENGLFNRIFRQRPLKPQQPGVCTIDGESARTPWAHPLAQRFRILQNLTNLRVQIPPDPAFRPLSREEFDKLYAKLKTTRRVECRKIRKILGLPEEARFNLDHELRSELIGDETAAKLAGKKLFGKAWHDLPAERQEEIVERLIAEPDEEAIVAFGKRLGLDEKGVRELAAVRLPQGHCHLGLPVLRAIVPIMERQGLGYAEALREAGFHHSDPFVHAGHDRLPYYGEVLKRWCQPVEAESASEDERRFGRIANPTVHVGLNQLRKLVNAIIDAYGKPREIHVELARELKLGRQDLDRLKRRQRENQHRNRQADEVMRQAGIDPEALSPTSRAENRLRYRLWLELSEERPQWRLCPYSGRPIGMHTLFSDAVEIEHILPFSRTLDDSPANKTIAFREANRDKGDRTPYEAFGHSPTIQGRRYDWAKIAERATRMPKNKAWRFAPDAMERFQCQGDFIDRQLNDTSYLARLTRLYLRCLYRKEEGDRVLALPGRLTALLRAKWSLNELLAEDSRKNRDDHRHHAIDAAVIACTDRGALQTISRRDERGRQRIVVPLPYEAFRRELRERLATMIVSHKPEHGIAGRLHEETAYGPTAIVNDKGTPCYATRWPLSKFESRKHLEQVRDLRLRGALVEHVERETKAGKTFKEALQSFRDPQGNPLRHIRVLVPYDRESMVEIHDPNGHPYKYYHTGKNAYMDVLELPNGKWVGYTVSVFDANRLAATPNAQPPWKASYPAARRVMRLFKGDLVTIGDESSSSTVYKIYQTKQGGRTFLAPHNAGGQLQKRHDAKEDPFRWLMLSASKFPKVRLRKARVDILGRVRTEERRRARADRGDRERRAPPLGRSRPHARPR